MIKLHLWPWQENNATTAVLPSPPKRCPAFGHVCTRVRCMNHFETVCQQKKNIQLLDTEDDVDDDEYLVVNEYNAWLAGKTPGW